MSLHFFPLLREDRVGIHRLLNIVQNEANILFCHLPRPFWGYQWAVLMLCRHSCSHPGPRLLALLPPCTLS